MRILLALLAFVVSPAVFAAESTGAGLTVGSPYGFTGRTWLSQENSLDYGLGWDLLNSHKLEAYSDFLWNRPDAFEIGRAHV